MVNPANENMELCEIMQKMEVGSKDDQQSHSPKYLEEFGRLQKELIRLSLHIETVSKEKRKNTSSDALVQRYNRKLDINNDKSGKSFTDKSGKSFTANQSNYGSSNGYVDKKAINKSEAGPKYEQRRKKDNAANKQSKAVNKDQANKAQANKAQANKAQANKAQANKAQVNKEQANKAQANKAQVNKEQANKAQVNKAQVNKAQANKEPKAPENVKKPKAASKYEKHLQTYINNMVKEYIAGTDKESLFDQLVFSKGSAALQEHAELLVSHGLGRIVEEELRVNHRNHAQSFVTMSRDRLTTVRDGVITTMYARNHAFHGDIVRAFVLHPEQQIKAPEQEAKAPEQQTKAPEQETKAPEQPTKAPEQQTKAPEQQTKAPEQQTKAPEQPTKAPEQPTKAPEQQTKALPTDTTDKDATKDVGETLPDKGPKAFVISIVKEVADRLIIGTIDFASLSEMNPKKFYKVQPVDTRYPSVKIRVEEALRFAQTDPMMQQRNESAQLNGNPLAESFGAVQIRGVDKTGDFYGELKEYLGEVNDLDAEIKAILRTNGFNEDSLNIFQNSKEIPPFNDDHSNVQTSKQYTDLRKKCIFTIDPLTARDLDDALSLEIIDEDTFEIGVHISDVSAYLCENTQLDDLVRDRATSIYLGNKVVHMLPAELCMKCSLLPGQDKMAFSVTWQLNSQGEIIGKEGGRFHRSLINSCTQFAYEHAQRIIDSPDTQQLDATAFPAIHNGHTIEDVAGRIRRLNAIAKNMRRRRFENGSLSLNNPKLRFTFDDATGEPIEYSIEERGEANFLIEEFMLLANQEAARLTFKHYPENALLRNHGPPLAKSMNTLLQKLSKLELAFDASSSKTVHESMQRLCAKQPDVMEAFLTVQMTKPMARAKYFCPEGEDSEALMRHYALSIPIYTHFTSPIRRYADIIVHRHLAAALDYCPPTARTGSEITEFAKNCNEKNYNAKKAGEDCNNMYFRRYITAHKAILKRVVIFEIFQTFFNAVTIDTGHVITVNYADQSCPIDTAGVPNYITISGNKRLQLISDIEVLIKVVNKKIVGFIGKKDIKKMKGPNIVNNACIQNNKSNV